MHRAVADRWGITLRHRYDEVGLPCRNTTGSPAPTSWKASCLPSTSTKDFDSGVVVTGSGLALMSPILPNVQPIGSAPARQDRAGAALGDPLHVVEAAEGTVTCRLRLTRSRRTSTPRSRRCHAETLVPDPWSRLGTPCNVPSSSMDGGARGGPHRSVPPLGTHASPGAPGSGGSNRRGTCSDQQASRAVAGSMAGRWAGPVPGGVVQL